MNRRAFMMRSARVGTMAVITGCSGHSEAQSSAALGLVTGGAPRTLETCQTTFAAIVLTLALREAGPGVRRAAPAMEGAL